jgi:hypothetical protein
MNAISTEKRRLCSLLAGFAAGLALLTAASAQTPDADRDGVADAQDNCAQAANANQQDADGDGKGNLCDGDLDNHGETNEADFELMKGVMNQEASASSTAAAADMDGDGRVTAKDFSRLRSQINTPPTPAAPVP